MRGKSVTLWLFVFGLSLAAAKAPEVRPDGYEYYEAAEGSFKMHPAAAWRDARLVCHGEGGELASPETPGLLAAMSTALLSSAESPEQVFTGINDLYSKGLFSSLSGTRLSGMSVRWAAGAPSNLTTRDNCLALRRNGLLRDTTCDTALPYLCFRKEVVGPEGKCGMDSGFKYIDYAPSSCYKYHTSRSAFSEAYATCRREGADLLVLSSSVEPLAIMFFMYPDKVHIHVGATRWNNGTWMTVHGQTLQQAGFNQWVDSENNSTDSCASLRLGRLARNDCTQKLPFICEKKLYI